MSVLSKERLTERDEYGNADIIGVDGVDLQGNLLYEEMNRVTFALNKLAEYEDLEEQGLLLRLPCKVGDTVYVIEDECEYMLGDCHTKQLCRECEYRNLHIEESVLNSTKDIVLQLELFGKTVFLTQSEAEEALKKGDDNHANTEKN